MWAALPKGQGAASPASAARPCPEPCSGAPERPARASPTSSPRGCQRLPPQAHPGAASSSGGCIPCSGRPSESPGRGGAGCGSGPRWARAGRAGRGSWAAGQPACPHIGQGSRRRRWRNPLQEWRRPMSAGGRAGAGESWAAHLPRVPAPLGGTPPPPTWCLWPEHLVLVLFLEGSPHDGDSDEGGTCHAPLQPASMPAHAN